VFHQPLPLEIQDFQQANILDDFQGSTQGNYIKCYLKDLGAKSIVIEPHYFDKDYLSEFANFYSTSSRGYPNSCKRIHFFSCDIDRQKLEKLLGEDSIVCKEIQDSYLGFSVIRPITVAPFGNTVLKWYPDLSTSHQRIRALRNYHVHLSGISLCVEGLSWQQQDTGVGACATVALWSALHSSAFDEYHAVPTTAQITKAATKHINLGLPVFPNSGLNVHQICDAIKEMGLTPMVLTGDQPSAFFSTERFASNCASFIRSGYPVIALGAINGNGHAICISGFREAKLTNLQNGMVNLSDSEIDTIYLHDDNLGPNVRAKLSTHQYSVPGIQTQFNRVGLKAKAPDPSKYSSQRTSGDDPTNWYYDFFPYTLIVAVHSEIRTSADHLNGKALSIGNLFNIFLNPNKASPTTAITTSATIMDLNLYVGKSLSSSLNNVPQVLSKVRLELLEKIPPMSYHLGVIRLGIGSQKFLDILFDTTDTDRNHPVFATIAYTPSVNTIISTINSVKPNLISMGIPVINFSYLIEAY